LCNSCARLAGLVLCFIACFILLVIAPYVQYTPPTPTRRNCRVESRRRRVLNSQLAHDDCRRVVRSHRRHDATRLRCRQICSDSSTLSLTSCELCRPLIGDAASAVYIGLYYFNGVFMRMLCNNVSYRIVHCSQVAE